MARQANADSAYAKYCAEKGISAISVFVQVELREMIDAVKERDGIKETDLVRKALADYVNAQNLERDGKEWRYVIPTPVAKESKDATIARQARELEEARAMLAKLQGNENGPKAPTQIADAHGNIQEKAA